MIHWTDIVGQIAHSGKFKVLDSTKQHQCDIIGILGNSLVHLHRKDTLPYTAYIDNCTLIARSYGDEDNPDDMTIEETNKYEKLLYKHWNDIKLRWEYSETPESFLYLISIGVLPPNVSTDGVEFITTNG